MRHRGNAVWFESFHPIRLPIRGLFDCKATLPALLTFWRIVVVLGRWAIARFAISSLCAPSMAGWQPAPRPAYSPVTACGASRAFESRF